MLYMIGFLSFPKLTALLSLVCSFYFIQVLLSRVSSVLNICRIMIFEDSRPLHLTKNNLCATLDENTNFNISRMYYLKSDFKFFKQ